MDYTIVQAKHKYHYEALDFLIDAVNDKLAEGYETVGGVSMSLADDQSSGAKMFYVVQAIIYVGDK